MKFLIPLSYICINMFTSLMLTRYVTLRPSHNDNNIEKVLTFIVFFFTVFIGIIHFLGYVNLFTDLKVVHYTYYLIISLIFLFGVGLIMKARAAPGKLIPDPIYCLNFLSGFYSLQRRVIRLLITLFVIAFISMAIMLVIGYPDGYEAKAYHLPIAIHMFQSQSLLPWDNASVHTVAANMSIYLGVLLRFFSDHLVAISNFIFLMPYIMATYGLSRETGADRPACIITSLGFLTIPIVGFHFLRVEADLGGIAFISIAVYFALKSSNNRLSNYTLSGLAAGLAYGFKTFHLISIIILCILIIIMNWNLHESGASIRRIWLRFRPPMIFLVFTFIISSFWFIRNYVQLGNPLHPVHIPVFDVFGWVKPQQYYSNHDNQFEWVRSSIEWFVYPWNEWHFANENFKHSSGLGAFFAATVPIACLTSFVRTIQRKDEKWPLLASLLTGGFFVLAIWWLIDQRQPRYFLGALAFFAPLVAWTINQTKGQSRKIYELVIILCSLIMLFVITSNQIISFGNRMYHQNYIRHYFYSYPKTIDLLPRGSTIVNLGSRTMNFALFGEKYQNRVISFSKTISLLKVKKTFDPKTQKYGSKSAYLPLSTLRKMGATHVFTEGDLNLIPGECVILREIDRMDKAPVPKTSLKKELRLFKVDYCDI